MVETKQKHSILSSLRVETLANQKEYGMANTLGVRRDKGCNAANNPTSIAFYPFGRNTGFLAPGLSKPSLYRK